ncbi:MAG: Nif3-like dinuclear metal center hexameric protein, partial [Eubacterium sp.]|nr:Nif3-like dinuclear metal center hexameric protein [Candidatus Colimonas fimequi]
RVPLQLQEEWDNSGLIIGFEDRQVSRVLTCLEINMEVVDEAIAMGAEMIISHHPLIFGSISSLNANTPKGAVIIRLIRHGISVYSCHTPFDKVNGGNNDALAGILDLRDITDLAGDPVKKPADMLAAPSEMHIGRIGRLHKTLKFSQVIDMVCENLGIPISQISAVGHMDAEISRIGICTGAGSEFIEVAAGQGCEAFITGDVKYHQAQDAREIGMCVIDAGHFGTEKIFAAVMQLQMEKLVPGSVEFVASEVNLDPFEVL